MNRLLAASALALAVAMPQPAAAQDGLAQNGRGPVLSGPLLGANERLLVEHIDLVRARAAATTSTTRADVTPVAVG